MRITLVVLTSIMLISCVSSTKIKTNKTDLKATSVSPTLQQQYKGLKRKVAIARFTDETKRSNNFFVDKNYDRLGKQATDILASRMVQSGKFIVLERADFNQLTSEQKLQGLSQKAIGADYIIVGSISEYGRETQSETGIFSRNKIQLAKATVNVRLIDVKTGQAIFSQEASGSARNEASSTFGVGESAAFDTSLDDEAISAAISQLVTKLMENLMDEPWQAYFVGEKNGQFIITGGSEQGIKIGDTFGVWQPGEKVKNPQTGMMIELPGKQITTVSVKQVTGKGENAISFVESAIGLANYDLATLVIREIK